MKYLKKFNELYVGAPINRDVVKDLKLDKLSKNVKDDNYFFTEKKPKNKVWDNHIFCVVVKKVSYDIKAKSVVFDIEVTYKFHKYDIVIIVDHNDDTFFGSRKENGELERFNKDAREKMGTFYKLTEEIVNEILPSDFWEVRINAS